MPFFGAMYYVLRCRTSLTVTSTAILTSPSNYAYFGSRIRTAIKEQRLKTELQNIIYP